MYVGAKSNVTHHTYLGKHVCFNGMRMYGRGKIEIGNYFHSGQDCQIITSFHNYEGNSIPYDNSFIDRDVKIGDCVWLGNNVIILGGVKIGEGAIIQAGSVVCTDIPEFSIAGGHPAKPFKHRDVDHYKALKEKSISLIKKVVFWRLKSYMKMGGIVQKYKIINPAAKAAMWYTICNVLMKGISLLSTPIFTRILTEEEYGTFAIFQSWFNILIIFTSLNAFLGGYTKGLILYKDDREGYTSSSLGMTTTITIFFFCAYIIAPNFWNDIFELPSNLVIALFAELLFMPALDFWVARERFDYKYKKYVIVTLSMSVACILVAVIAVVSSEQKGDARVYSDAVVKSLFCMALFYLIIKSGKKWFSKEYWKYNLSYNIPLIPHYLSMYVLSQSDRLMIGKMVGKPQAAFYSVAYTIATMMNLIMSALNNALNPYIYKSIADGKITNIKKATAPLFLLMASLSILTMSFAPEIVYIFAGEKYAEAIYVIPPVAASVYFIFVYSMFSSISFYFQKTKLIALATLMSAFANLGLNYLFINLFGYFAAGYTTLFCYIFLAVFHYCLYRKVSKKEMDFDDEIFSLKTVLLCSFLVLGIMILMIFTYDIRIIRYLIIVIMFVVLYIYRNKIISIFKSIK